VKKGWKLFSFPKQFNTGFQREMKKTDTQFWTPTKQRKTMPMNPTMPTRTPSKEKFCK
jgi:hypothetical protein